MAENMQDPKNTPVYKFDEQYSAGKKGEAFLDKFFAERGHNIQKATRVQQRTGIDRIFRKDSKAVRVEYKTDLIAHRTGKVFIETVSVDTNGKMGWAYRSRADLLAYYIPELPLILVIPLARLREQLPHWLEQFPTRAARNKGYATHGILIPTEVLRAHASQAFDLSPNAQT